MEPEEEVVGNKNDDRLKQFAAIADSADALRVQEGEFVPDDNPDPADEQPEEVVEEEASEEPAARKFKLKVNGRELELTEDELIKRAQKVESADRYLADAAEALRKAQVSPDPAQQQTSDEDDLALVRALQMGTEEEAVQAIRKIRATPSKKDDVASLIDQRLTFREAAAKFESDFKDVLSDPMLKRLAIQKDAELLQNGDTRSYLERYTEIGNELREWKSSLSKGSEPASKVQDKLERKSKVTSINAANVRATPVIEEEPDDSPTSVIEKMARSRGQRN